MGRHFLQYVTREVDMGMGGRDCPVAWDRPTCHANRDRRYQGRVAPGDVIWLVSAVRQRGRTLPPSLDARVVVDDGGGWSPRYVASLRRAGRTVYPASLASRWFPIGDDTALFTGLHALTSLGTATPILAAPRGGRTVAMRLALAGRRMRELTPESVERLVAWEAVRTRPVVFISYSWCDGGAEMMDLAAALTAAGYHVWLDVAAVPRRVMDLNAPRIAEELRRGLGEAIASVDLVIAVETASYGAVGWTKWERKVAGDRAVSWRPGVEGVEVLLGRVEAAVAVGAQERLR